MVYDATEFIKASIYEVTRTIIEASYRNRDYIFIFRFPKKCHYSCCYNPFVTNWWFGAMLVMGYSINLLTCWHWF